ncbi:hypothetical protein AYI68_g1595 [Smittium mucronatum]|uniref:PEP5/VPS11 N-terminal domain-containing protein n=1 Tax=Smittium mucronatum TaxID=133383 RepID=A0A1R0H542_9FUNG|nr:hypothetical protein AYI68_g1595 [Smittium mucronatum]
MFSNQEILEIKDNLIRRISIERPHNSPFPVTAVSVNCSISKIAIGFGNGCIFSITGDILNGKKVSQNLIYEANEPITSNIYQPLYHCIFILP